MRDKVYTLDEIRAIATPIAKRYGVEALYLFGSYARGDATPESDLDFRVERGSLVDALAMGGLYGELEASFDKSLDVLTTQMLSRRFLDKIQSEEVTIYAKS